MPAGKLQNASTQSICIDLMEKTTGPTDQTVLERLRAGDQQVYKELYCRYDKRLFSFAFQYLKSRELAKDAVQEAFIKLWVHRRAINVNVKSFLFTTVRNHVMNMIRNDRRRMLKAIQLEQQSKRHGNATEDGLLYAEYQTILASAMREMPAGRRLIFEMKTDQGLSNAAIASQLDITIHTVKSQYYLASKFVRNYLVEHAGISVKRYAGA